MPFSSRMKAFSDTVGGVCTQYVTSQSATSWTDTADVADLRAPPSECSPPRVQFGDTEAAIQRSGAARGLDGSNARRYYRV